MQDDVGWRFQVRPGRPYLLAAALAKMAHERRGIEQARLTPNRCAKQPKRQPGKRLGPRGRAVNNLARGLHMTQSAAAVCHFCAETVRKWQSALSRPRATAWLASQVFCSLAIWWNRKVAGATLWGAWCMQLTAWGGESAIGRAHASLGCGALPQNQTLTQQWSPSSKSLD